MPTDSGFETIFKENFELLHNRREATMWKIFLEMTPLGIKTCGKSAFDILKRKNVFLIQGRRIVYWSGFSLQNSIRLSWIREAFFASKMSNSDYPHFFTPRGVIFTGVIFDALSDFLDLFFFHHRVQHEKLVQCYYTFSAWLFRY